MEAQGGGEAHPMTGASPGNHCCSPERQQLELMQRLGRIGFWEFDPATRSFSLPPASLDLLSSLLGAVCHAAPNLRDCMSDPERRRFRAALDQAVADDLPMRLELQLLGHDGRQAHIVIKGMLVGSGDSRRFAGTFRDITREKQTELQREEVLSQLHAVISGLPMGLTVFDEDLRLLFWNDHIYDILGLPQGAVYKYVRFEELIRYPAERGEYGPGDPAELVAARAERARRFEPHRFERAARNGRTLLVDGYPFRFGGRLSGFVTTYTDITEHKANEAQIVHQNQVLKTIIDNFPGGISLFDANLNLAASNRQMRTLLEFPDSLIDRPVVRFEDLARFNAARGEYGPGDPEELVAAIMARTHIVAPHKMERTRPNGTTLEIIGAPIDDGGFVTIYTDITERKRAEAQIRNMALQDSLTNLPNRLALNEFIEQSLDRAAAHGERFALLFLDLDGFKRVNDTLGHDAGDQLLLQIADRLRTTVRETDTVARLGGDEFVVLLRDIEDAEAPQRIAGEIVSSIAAPFRLGETEARIGTSIGIALHPESGDDRESLLQAADRAMYQAKSGGKGTWRVASR